MECKKELEICKEISKMIWNNIIINKIKVEVEVKVETDIKIVIIKIKENIKIIITKYN